MEENIWKYGLYELDKKALLKYLQSNANSYIEYNGYDDNLRNLFNDSLSYIMKGIEDNRISGNGLGVFTENDTNLEEDDVTKYVHTIANSMGKKFNSVKKKEDKENEKETSLQEMFDYNKHGLSYGFNRKYNPFGTDGSYSLWKSGFKSQEDLNNSLLNYIGQHKTNIQSSNYDFSKSLIDKDSYINMLTDLENDIRTDGVKDSDLSKLKFFGFDPSTFILQQLQKSDSPWGHIKWDSQSTDEKLPEEAPTVPEGFKAVLQLDGSYEIIPENENVNNQMKSEIGNLPINEYINNFKTLGLEESDGYRLAGLLLDVSSIINPEPFTAAGMGYVSDYLNYHADELDGINDSWWDDALNVGLSTLGAIPLIGDLGMTGKVAKNLIKTSKSLGKLLLIPGIFAGVANSEELKQSVNNIINNDFTVNDLRNTWTVLLLALGTTNAIKSGTAKKKALNISENSEEALVVLLKNNGKTEDYQFSGKDKEDLLALKDKPEEFNKYIRENFEGLDKAEAAKIKTTKGDIDWENRKHWYSKPKRKESTKTVNIETKPVYEKGQIPGKWDRARYFLSNTDEVIKTKRKGVPNQSTSTTPKESEEVSFNVTTGKYETKTASEKIDLKIADDAILNKLGEAKSEIGQKPEEKKIEIKETPKKEEKEKTIDYTKAREAISKNKSVKATEIEPDIKSKATETADTKSEVTKYNASNIRKEFDKLKGKSKTKAKWVLKNAKQDKKSADLVKQDPSLASKDFNEMLAALQNADKKITYEQAFKILIEAGYYKKGGIIKATTGVKFPEWFNYKQLSLTGWNKDLNKDKWTTLGIGFHTDADSLLSVYDANTNYTNDVNAVNSDILNYYNSGEYKNIADFINAYNTDAVSINNFWNTNHTYGENTGNHAPTFKKLFASRSADGKTGNLNYNLGYQDNLENVMGSTMWHRRMDWYEKNFNDLTDLEKQNRIHAIKLSDGNYGYIYKKHDGTIAEISADEAKRIGDLKNNSQLGNYDTKTDSYDAGSLPEGVVTPKNNAILYPGGPKTSLEETNKIEKPEKPDQSFFTVDKALAALNYFRARGHNKELLDLANRMVPLLYDPMEHHRSVYGNLRAISEGNRAAGEIRSRASKPLTSDGSLQTAGLLEAENLAQQYIRQGWLSDDETMQKMSELAWQQEKENRENRYNIAMKNRENMHLVSKEKLMALMGKKRADYESLTNHINEWRTWIGAKQQADEDKANILFNRQMLNYILNNPLEYISNWRLYEDIWNRYNNGETLSANELRTISQIQNHLSNAYYNEIYGKGDYFGYGISRSPWNPILKKGGTITKNQVDSIIKYLKESNNNYNKAIDRSVRGLYNHIKLQRKK